MKRHRYSGAILALIAVLFAFLVAGSLLVANQQKRLLIETAYNEAVAQVDLMIDASFEALLKGDYVTIRTFVRRWGEAHDEFIVIRATAPNGFVVGEYRRPAPSSAGTFVVSRKAMQDGEELLQIEFIGTYQDAERATAILRSRLLIGAALFTFLLGIVLWRSVRKMALAPLEREIAAREWAEEELRRAHDALERKVEDRTAELQRELEERNRIERILLEREEHIRLLLASTAEGIYGVDTYGKCTFCNPSCLRMLGFRDEKDLIGRNIHLLIHHRHADGTDYAEADCTIYRAYRKREGSHSDREVFWRTDGTSFPVEFWSYPVIRDDTVIGAVVAFVDITERRKLEAQLLQSQKMEAIGTLAGGVAHDFNNILTAILGYASILQMKMENGDVLRQYVLHIIDSTKRAASLTQSLLAFSRKQLMAPRNVDLNDIVRHVEKLLQRLIGEDIELVTSLAPCPFPILADAIQIEQVLMNLATNARDAMSNGGKLIIRSERAAVDQEYASANGLAAPGEYAVLSVSDTGSGMDKRTRDKIFEPFFTTKELGRGTGLGLAIVYGIVKQHGGIINVYSETGEGTVFRIYLPLAGDPVSHRDRVEKEEESPRGTETVLIAEDDDALRLFIRALLEESGYTVIDVPNGEEAVRAFGESPDRIGLVLLDTVMPRKNGKEAFHEIKAIRPGIKAVFMSGYTADILDAKGLIEEGIEFIRKPMTPKDLLTRLREVLDRPS